MKKFYKNPVVEITVFDVEDVITVSVVGTTLSDVAAEQLIDAIENNNAVIENTSVIAAKKYSAYNW
ncbi:MAG: hypothetical protein IJE62_00470 [Clostridia bacterium]|nr:hypothetical protein [Clostridia bacterium]